MTKNEKTVSTKAAMREASQKLSLAIQATERSRAERHAQGQACWVDKLHGEVSRGEGR
jgi:hypothetical protein